MERSRYEIAVILVNYNSSAHTLRCIETIRERTSAERRYQIVVVDNASEPADVAALASLVGEPDVTLVHSRLNTGFSGGNMQGVQVADAEYYFFLNNDCRLLDDCLGVLFAYLEAHADVALCSGEMFDEGMQYASNFGYFPSVGHALLGTGFERMRGRERMHKKRVRYDHALDVDLLAGASMFVRAQAFDAIGGFDTIYFLYCEEEDIALRLRTGGHGVRLVPGARFQHLRGGSTPDDPRYLREFYVSFAHYLRKHHSFVARVAFRAHWVVKNLRKHPALAWYCLCGPELRDSLRHRQRVRTPRWDYAESVP